MSRIRIIIQSILLVLQSLLDLNNIIHNIEKYGQRFTSECTYKSYYMESTFGSFCLFGLWHAFCIFCVTIPIVIIFFPNEHGEVRTFHIYDFQLIYFKKKEDILYRFVCRLKYVIVIL